MRRIYISKTEVPEALARINRLQNARKEFVNVAVKPYRGKKYDPESTAVLVIG